MKIVLNSDVEKLGRKGEVVEVARGYARNFLIPRNMAIIATKGALKQAESLQRSRAAKDTRDRAVFEQLAQKIEGARLTIQVRAGSEGHMYGSVTNADIAELLGTAIESEFDRRKIIITDPIKSLGTHGFLVHLPSEVVAKGTIEVVSDGFVEPDPEPEPEPDSAPADVEEEASNSAP
ncbi:MAG: 50S ribosomal protein L9 [Actinomycetota bacterium]